MYAVGGVAWIGGGYHLLIRVLYCLSYNLYVMSCPSGVKRDGAIKIPGGGRILFDITLLEIEDGASKTLYQWEPPAPLSWESTQVISSSFTFFSLYFSQQLCDSFAPFMGKKSLRGP